MTDRGDAPRSEPLEITIDAIHELVRRHAPSFWRDREIPDSLRLDDGGIGFDSIGLVELLVACERELGIPLAPDLLLDDAMTVGDLYAKLAAASNAARR